MALYLVILAIVAHRFLRLDLISDAVARLRLQSVLLLLLMLTMTGAVLLRALRVRLSVHVLSQWTLWLWALISKLVADGTSACAEFLVGDYGKDVVFLTLISFTANTIARLRALCWVFVVAMTVIALCTVPQRFGTFKCYHYKLAGELNYFQETDERLCQGAADCFNVPPEEAHLREEGWACERAGPFGLATVLDRIHYVGNLVDPNALGLALVMACALALGLLTWPRRPPLLERVAARGGGGVGSSGQALLRLLLFAAFGLLAVAVVLAASRAAQLGLALTLLCFFYARIGWPGLLLAGLLGAPVVMISNRNAAEAAYSTFTRIQTYINGYQAFMEHPLFGVGYGNYEKISFINAHNSFLLAITETGFIGGGLFMLGVYLAFKCVVMVIRWPLPPMPDARALARLGAPPQPLLLLMHQEAQHARAELRHLARTLLAMLVGVLACVFFLSLAFDVMWLFPIGIVGAFHLIAKDQIPDFALRLSFTELCAVFVSGALFPALLVAISTRSW